MVTGENFIKKKKKKCEQATEDRSMNSSEGDGVLSDAEKRLLDDEFCNCDELREYFDCSTDRGDARTSRTESVLAGKLDPVPRDLVGRLDVRAVINVAPKFARDILQYLLHQTEQGSKQLQCREPEAFKAMIELKGLPRFQLDDRMLGHMEALADVANCGLLKESGRPSRANDPALIRTSKPEDLVRKKLLHAGAFTVPKSGVDPTDNRPLLRFIIDARLANAVFKTCGPMLVFQVEALLATTSRLSQDSRGWYAISADLRHWFHQIKIPDHWQEHFRMSHHAQTWVPTTLPMGFNSAAAIAQAAFWAIILRGLHGDGQTATARRMRLGIPKLDESVYPHWLPLDCGGGVFVLIDNVFVCTPCWIRINDWKKWLKAAEAESSRGGVNVTFKEEAGESIKVVPLVSGKTESVKFCGIEFTQRQCRPIRRPEAFELSPGQLWTGTYRELASLIGKTIWCLRVAGEPLLQHQELMNIHATVRPPLCDEDDTTAREEQDEEDDSSTHPTAASAATAASSASAAAQRATTRSSWQTRIELSVDQTACLVREVERASRDDWINLPFSPTSFDLVSFGATDASLENGTGRMGWAGSVADMGVVAPFQEHLPIEQHQPHHDPHIALAELRAIMEFVRAARQEMNRQRAETQQSTTASSDTRPCGLHIVATDSMAAKGMIERRYSDSERARALLVEFYKVLGDDRIFLFWIPSDDNPADGLSRSSELHEAVKWKKLQSRFEFAFAAAESTFRMTGRSTAGASRAQVAASSESHVDEDKSVSTSSSAGATAVRRHRAY